MHAIVLGAAQAAGRAPDAVTPALYARIVVTDTAATAEHAIDDSLLLRFIALTRPAEAYTRHGTDHPLGAGAFGLTSLLPTDYGRTQALDLARSVPQQVVRETVLHGTPDDIARQIEGFIAVGVRHVQVTNMTPLVDPRLGPDSEGLLSEVVQTVRAGVGA
jgi:phthiodiolone/phenolphthiodiolone dimycocerosates ketoreductase